MLHNPLGKAQSLIGGIPKMGRRGDPVMLLPKPNPRNGIVDDDLVLLRAGIKQRVLPQTCNTFCFLYLTPLGDWIGTMVLKQGVKNKFKYVQYESLGKKGLNRETPHGNAGDPLYQTI